MKTLSEIRSAKTPSKMIPVKYQGKTIGSIWKLDGEWHSEHNKSGLTWATDNQKDAKDIVVDREKEGPPWTFGGKKR